MNAQLSFSDSYPYVPKDIGKLSLLRFLYFIGCKYLEAILDNFYQLTSLHILNLGDGDCGDCALRIQDLTNFRHLTGLYVRVIIGSTTGTKGTWLEMRNLKWRYRKSTSSNGEKDILPHDKENLKKLNTLFLENYPTQMFPDSVCRFQHLEK